MTRSPRESKLSACRLGAVRLAALALALGLLLACNRGNVDKELQELEQLAAILEQPREHPDEILDELERYLDDSAERRAALRQALAPIQGKHVIDERGANRDRYVRVVHRLTAGAVRLRAEARAEGAESLRRFRALAPLLAPEETVPAGDPS